MIESKDYYIDQLNSSKANKMVELYHYSGVGFKKAILNLGIYRKTDNLLVGVLQWGCSAQEKIRLDRYVTNPISTDEYLELNRFCMADSEGKNSESQAISIAIKWIKKNCPHIRLLVSYAGRKEGNYGYIYQATNWEYLGYFISSGFWLLDGQERHQISVWYYYKKYANQNLSFTEGVKSLFHDVRQTWTKQFIYIQRLDKKLVCASEVLPYPKPSTEYPICTKIKILKQDDNYLNVPKKEKEKVFYYYKKGERLFTTSTLKKREKNPHKKKYVFNVDKETRKLLKPKQIFLYAMYTKDGNLEKIGHTVQELSDNKFLPDGIRKSCRSEGLYYGYYFRKYEFGEQIPDHLNIKYICEIDGIYFVQQKEISQYVDASRQAVSIAVKRHSKTINGIEIHWLS